MNSVRHTVRTVTHLEGLAILLAGITLYILNVLER